LFFFIWRGNVLVAGKNWWLKQNGATLGISYYLVEKSWISF
jgi:hypothetical protein